VAHKRFYTEPPPGVDPDELTGALIVVEGPDGSGRSTHIALLTEWLEQRGYPVAQTGLTRSELVAVELDRAKLGNVLSPRTMALFYATDFYDQLQNVIVPAMRAGSVVIADRYIFTLMARDRLRGGNPKWLESVYSMAIVPDKVFHFSVSTETLMERTLTSHTTLDYWESGMDVGLSRDWFTSFQKYQVAMRDEFEKLREQYGFEIIDADASLAEIQTQLRGAVGRVLESAYAAPAEPPKARMPKGKSAWMNLEVG
jgi:dTMP kinase